MFQHFAKEERFQAQSFMSRLEGIVSRVPDAYDFIALHHRPATFMSIGQKPRQLALERGNLNGEQLLGAGGACD